MNNSINKLKFEYFAICSYVKVNTPDDKHIIYLYMSYFHLLIYIKGYCPNRYILSLSLYFIKYIYVQYNTYTYIIY